ncbi:MAG: helix-turn-helix transcriptional regulator [bacterium]|nr:helix-turn-helix transcriptional regulator [bacterium]
MEERDLRKRVALNFKRLRKERAWTQAKAAEIGAVDSSYIGQIETAQITFGTKAQMKWASIFRVDVSEFLAPEKSMSMVGSVAADGITFYHADKALNGLTNDEVELLECYRQMPEDKRKHLLATARLIKE